MGVPEVLLLGAAWLAGRWGGPRLVSLLARGGCLATNYRGEQVPVGTGLLVPLVGGPVLLAAAAALPPPLPGGDGAAGSGAVELVAAGCLLFGFGLLGLLDDTAGDGTARGLRGHLARLLTRGELTTGGLKALGGGLLALAASLAVAGGAAPGAAGPAAGLPGAAGLAGALLAGGVIALGANAANLLDLRPGRCLKGVLLAIPAVGLLAPAPWVPRLLATVAGLALALLPLDLRRRGMLGDGGANPLGAALGAALGWGGPPGVALGALGGLVLLHLYAERRSLSALIERVPVLAALDRAGRGRR